LLFQKGGELTLEVYIDIDHAGPLVDRRCTTDYCMFLRANLVTWRSKKQFVIARSIVEVKFRDMAHEICELWLKIILDDLRIKRIGPMKLYCDNNSAINIADNLVQHHRTKHIEINMHFIKEKLNSRQISTPYVPSCDQLVNVLTKGLP